MVALQGPHAIQHVLKLAGFWHLAPWALEKQGSYIACQGSQWNHGNASSTSCAPAGTCPITWFSSFWMFTCSVKQAASHRRTFLHMPEAFRKLDATCTCDFFRLYTLSCCLQPVCNWKPWRQVPKQYTHFCPTHASAISYVEYVEHIVLHSVKNCKKSTWRYCEVAGHAAK